MVTVVVKDRYGFKDESAFQDVENAAEYALQFVMAGSFTVVLRFWSLLG